LCTFSYIYEHAHDLSLPTKTKKKNLLIKKMKTSLAFIVFLLWVVAITFSPLACGDGCSKEQTRALLEIRNSTNGFAFAGWDGRDCCQADGIVCDVENGRVLELNW
jgi:hypothetical protein